MIIYRDGVREGTRKTTITPRDINDVNNWLGRSNWTGDGYLHGDLNEFRIYDGAMNDAAAAESFAAGPDAAPGGEAPVITSIAYNKVDDEVTLTFKSRAGRTYDIYWSSNLLDFSNTVQEDVPSGGAETIFGPVPNPSPGSPRIFFRVSE